MITESEGFEHEPRDLSIPQADTRFILSVIIPTKNEAGNIEPLLTRLESATSGIPTQVVFVDDSSDDTPQVIQAMQGRFSLEVTLIIRPPNRRGNGLGGAVVEGFRVARAPWVCVMDGDLQHPPELIPQLLKQAEQTGADVVVGSRLAPGGDVSSLGRRRTLVSHALAMATRATFPVQLRKVTDPLSGLFLARRAAVNLDCLRPDGFKILLEILIRCPNLSVSEIPIQFGHRNAGQSKASIREVLRFFRLLFRLRPASDQRFVQFVIVGASGLLVNSLLLAFATEWLGIYYLVSVALATVGSTVWNFTLTELWVYYDRQQVHGRLGRFGMFFIMNNAALVLRGPIVFVLTSALGVHYLVSNLLSLAALTVLRYLFADKWIWGKARSVDRLRESDSYDGRLQADGLRIKKGATVSNVHSYDIHGIVTVISDAALPELEKFRTQTPIERPSIRVRLGRSPLGQQPAATVPASNVRRICYDEGLGALGFRAEIEIGDAIEVWASPLLKWSPHVLYTNLVEPILRWTFVEKGYALVHGACLDFGGKAYLVTARTDTGKTTSLLKILSHQRRATDQAAFISDDLTLVSPEGKALTYPKPLTISHHTVQAINARFLSRRQRFALLFQSRVHSRAGRRVAHSLSRTKLPMATINAVVQFLVPPPKYHVQQLVPGVKLTREAKLAGMLVIERFWTAGEAHLNDDEALDILLSNCEDAYGFPPYPAIKSFLYGSRGQDLQVVERQIIAQSLRGLPAIVLTSKDLDWWRRIPAFVDKDVAVHFRQMGKAISKPTPQSIVDRIRLRWLSKANGLVATYSLVPLRRFSDQRVAGKGGSATEDLYTTVT